YVLGMRLFTSLLLILTLLHSATLFGEVYDADSFSKLNNTMIKIESASFTTQIISNSPYSIEVPEGRYDLTAAHYTGGKINYIIKEKVFVNSSQTKFDLALIPYELYLLTPAPSADIANVASEGNEISKPTEKSNYDLIILVGFAIAIIIFGYMLFRGRVNEKTEEPVETKKLETRNAELKTRYSKSETTRLETQSSEQETMEYLPDKEAREVLKILKENEGRMYQKELREILNWSEAKMSITITELEVAGLLKRFKKGRDNMLKLLKE
ncbi:MAG: hypothetical protein Q7S22_03685, partial [Candidatus Micrarchaeota archaeon]|nr:hypothetical protein [Candidatus Micrarchaeota archaeon]